MWIGKWRRVIVINLVVVSNGFEMLLQPNRSLPVQFKYKWRRKYTCFFFHLRNAIWFIFIPKRECEQKFNHLIDKSNGSFNNEFEMAGFSGKCAQFQAVNLYEGLQFDRNISMLVNHNPDINNTSKWYRNNEENRLNWTQSNVVVSHFQLGFVKCECGQ